MPYRTVTTPFSGDADIAQFMLNQWLAFATDAGGSGGMAWIDQNASARGTTPNQEFWISKGTLLSPAAPYVFYRTTSDNMHIYTGNGINTLQELFDQPNNPMNCPAGTTLSPSYQAANPTQYRSPYMNRMDGVFDKAWLMGDLGSNYIHCVIKTRAREYRHFHVGLLSPLHSDLDASSFYVTGQFWSGLRDDETGGGGANAEHAPYDAAHILPFANADQGVTNNFTQFQMRSMFYIPNLGINTEDWYAMIGSDAQTLGTRDPSSSAADITKPVGDVNNTASSTFFGVGQITGYDSGLGAILFAADKTFTSNFRALIPIYVTAYSNFSSDIRQAPVAQIPDVFRINMREIDAEQEITVGADTYICFPMINKDSSNVLTGEGYSAYEGLAYKRVNANIT